jgi:hypothetical protein
VSARDDQRRVVVPVVASFDDAQDQQLAHCGQPHQDHGELRRLHLKRLALHMMVGNQIALQEALRE